MIEKLKRGEVVQRVITYMGKRIVEHFQPNKQNPDTYDRYFLPMNRDKSCANKINVGLELSEVEELLKTRETNNLKIVIK